MTEGFDICLHCGAEIMAVTFPSTLSDGHSVWTHVPKDGSGYLLIACGLVATPASQSRETDS